MNKTIIIAEAGVNHNGDIQLAKKLIDVAADAGANYVKFQTFRAEKLVTKTAQQAQYQQKNIGGGDNSQFAMLKQLELSEENHTTLIDYCNKKYIQFLSTAFDTDGINFLNTLGINLFKIPSGELTNYPYLKRIAQTGKPVILSTGMCTMEDIEQAIEVLESNGTSRSQITILHCNTEYPTPYADVNLKAMHTIGKAFNVPYGYSDHTLGIEVPVAAVAMGATVIEKHFTLDKTMEGPDHKASLEPEELKAMVNAIRNVEQAIGTGIKQPSPSEIKNIAIVRKSIVAACHISKGDIFTEQNITAKRPGTGISPMRWEQVIGKKAIKDFQEDELIIL